MPANRRPNGWAKGYDTRAHPWFQNDSTDLCLVLRDGISFRMNLILVSISITDHKFFGCFSNKARGKNNENKGHGEKVSGANYISQIKN